MARDIDVIGGLCRGDPAACIEQLRAAHAGDCDFVDPKAMMWRYAVAQLPTARLVVLQDAGHNAWIDQPQEFRRAVAQALESITESK